jgi:hypothetical protein
MRRFYPTRANGKPRAAPPPPRGGVFRWRPAAAPVISARSAAEKRKQPPTDVTKYRQIERLAGKG